MNVDCCDGKRSIRLLASDRPTSHRALLARYHRELMFELNDCFELLVM